MQYEHIANWCAECGVEGHSDDDLHPRPQFEEYRRAPWWRKLQMRVMWYVLNAIEVDPIPKPWEES